MRLRGEECTGSEREPIAKKADEFLAILAVETRGIAEAWIAGYGAVVTIPSSARPASRATQSALPFPTYYKPPN
jgi:hypothetical protein